MERIIKDFRIANNSSPISNNMTGVPRWYCDLLRTGDLSLVLLIEIVLRKQTIIPLLCVCTSRTGVPRWYCDLLRTGDLSLVLLIEIVPQKQTIIPLLCVCNLFSCPQK